MATIDTSAIADQLKRVYGDKLTSLFARHQMTYNQFKQTQRTASVRPGGAGYYFGLRQADIQSVGARGEGQYLPEPDYGASVQGHISPKLIYGSLRLSGLAIEAGKGNLQAFVDTQAEATMSTYQALITDLNRQCWGDGFGKLAELSTAGSTLTGAVWTLTCNNDLGTRYLRKGMIVDIYSSGGSPNPKACSQKISSIDPVNRTVTFNAAATTWRTYHPNSTIRAYGVSNAYTVADASQIVRQGARDTSFVTSDTPYEMVGLLGQYDDGTLLASHEGITVTSYPQFKANIMGNSSVNRELNIDLMLAAMDMTAAQAGMSPNLIRMGMGQRRKYFGLLAPDVRFAPASYKGGYEELAFAQNGAVKMIVDPVTQPNRMFFEVDGAIKRYELKGLDWGGFDPNKMHWRERYDEANMYLSIYTNLGVENRVALTLLKDLIEPAAVTMPF